MPGSTLAGLGGFLSSLGRSLSEKKQIEYERKRQVAQDERAAGQDRVWREELDRRSARERQGDVLGAIEAGGGEGPVPTSASSRLSIPVPEPSMLPEPRLGMAAGTTRPRAPAPFGRFAGALPEPSVGAPPVPELGRPSGPTITPPLGPDFDPLGQAMADPRWGRKFVGAGENLYIEEPDSRARRFAMDEQQKVADERKRIAGLIGAARPDIPESSRAALAGGVPAGVAMPPELESIVMDERRFPNTPEGQREALKWKAQAAAAGRAPRAEEGGVRWERFVDKAGKVWQIHPITGERRLLEGLEGQVTGGSPFSRFATPTGGDDVDDPLVAQRAEWDSLASRFGRERTEREIGPRPKDQQSALTPLSERDKQEARSNAEFRAWLQSQGYAEMDWR